MPPPLHAALVASCLQGAFPPGCVLWGLGKACLAASADHLGHNALCFALALFFLSFSSSALVLVHFDLAISESKFLTEAH